MEKTLGQDIKDLDQRKAFLIDNADEVVEKTYTKNFDAEQLADKKTRLAEVSIKINDFENEIKDFKAEIGLQMKPLKEERSSLLDDIKAKGEVVTGKAYKFTDREEGMTGFYNEEGVLIESRPATRDEMAENIFSMTRGKLAANDK
jgi:hypothetical protein